MLTQADQDKLEARLRVLAPSIVDTIVDMEKMGYARKDIENGLVLAVLHRPTVKAKFGGKA